MTVVEVGDVIKTKYTAWWDETTDNPVIIPSSFGIVTSVSSLGYSAGVSLWLDDSIKYITKSRNHVYHCSELRLVYTNNHKVKETIAND